MNTKTKRNIRVIHSRWQGNCRIEGLRLFREQGNDMAIITEGDGEDPRALFWPGYESVELLIYNPATDEYFATGAAGAVAVPALCCKRNRCEICSSRTEQNIDVPDPQKRVQYANGNRASRIGIQARSGQPVEGLERQCLQSLPEQ